MNELQKMLFKSIEDKKVQQVAEPKITTQSTEHALPSTTDQVHEQTLDLLSTKDMKLVEPELVAQGQVEKSGTHRERHRWPAGNVKSIKTVPKQTITAAAKSHLVTSKMNELEETAIAVEIEGTNESEQNMLPTVANVPILEYPSIDTDDRGQNLVSMFEPMNQFDANLIELDESHENHKPTIAHRLAIIPKPLHYEHNVVPHMRAPGAEASIDRVVDKNYRQSVELAQNADASTVSLWAMTMFSVVGCVKLYIIFLLLLKLSIMIDELFGVIVFSPLPPIITIWPIRSVSPTKTFLRKPT
jgi:hypothetical protein